MGQSGDARMNLPPIMSQDGRPLRAQWERVAPGEVLVKFPLQQVEPGGLTLRMAQYGAGPPQPLQLKTYAVAAQVEGFEFQPAEGEEPEFLFWAGSAEVPVQTIRPFSMMTWRSARWIRRCTYLSITRIA